MNREKRLLDQGWKFHLGDVEPPEIHPLLIIEVYRATKSQRGRGAAGREYDDSAWRTVDLPHDYAVEGTPSPKELSSHASLPRENAWYRRYFKLDEADRGKRITLEFDGVATHCSVWVNGHLMKRHFGGYNGFEIDVTDIVSYGAETNTIAVRVQNEEFEGWFYEGTGIYRHVWLNTTSPVCVGRYGTYIVSEKQTGDTWRSRVETTVRNDLYQPAEVTLRSTITAPDGTVAAVQEESFHMEPRSVCTRNTELQVENPALWSLEERNLYTLVSELLVDGERTDAYHTRFGYRTIEFDPDHGFFLNGKSVKIKGSCVHEDFGGQGNAYADNIKRYRIHQLQKMGCNGYRTAHNPHSVETMDICDEEGMLVMDENRWFESWGEGLEQLEDMVRRDRNHPCIIFWSLGNEEPIQAFESGKRVANAMRAAIKKLDATRPVMMAMHTGLLNGKATSVSDVIGANYNHQILDAVHAANPNTPIVGSENYSVSDEPEADRQGGIETWRLVNTRDYMMGYFIWTGLDYRGEHRYPTVLATCGGLDMNCLPKEDFYVYQMFWSEKPMVHVGPHWNLTPDADGNVQLNVYSNAERVELQLNGKKIAERKIDEYDLTPWTVPYAPGELRAIARNGESVVAEDVIRTASAAAKLALRVENLPVYDNGEDMALVSVHAVDAAGTPVPDADFEVRFSCTERGEIRSTCNGSEWDLVSCVSKARRLYNGRCAAVIAVRASDEPLIVRAEADGIEPAELTVPLEKGERRPFVEPVEASSLRGWKISPVVTARPDMKKILAEGPGADWYRTQVGVGYQPEFFNLSGAASFERVEKYAIYYLKTKLPEKTDEGLRLRFEEVNGKLDVFVLTEGSCFTGRKEIYEADALEVPVSGHPGAEAEIYVFLEAGEVSSGIMMPVHWNR